MPSGSIQTVLICAPSQTTQSPCPTGSAVVVTQAYLIDPAQATAFEAALQPFDYSVAASAFGLAFSSVVGLYLVARSAGTILNFIRRG